MSYGTKRVSDVNINDIDIYVHYTNTRGNVGQGSRIFKVEDPSTIISKVTTNIGEIETIDGMYNISLNGGSFNEKGIYTLLIQPKKIYTRITDISTLSAQPDIRGIVLDLNLLGENTTTNISNDKLVGYRVEYYSNDNAVTGKINNVFRLITSNNFAEPVVQNTTNNNDRAVKYRFNDNSNLIFCTLTPSSSNSARPNVLPFIGEVNQKIALVNTHFDPIMVEVEMVDYTIEDIAIGMFGNQSKSVEDGIYTIYDFNNEIYKQFNMYEIKETYENTPLFEIKEERTVIDTGKKFDIITSDIENEGNG